MTNLKRINQVLIFFIALVVILYFGSSFLIPMVFGIFLAMLMTPFSDRLEKKGVNRIFSSILSTLVVFIVTSGIVFLVVFQLRTFLSDLPAMREQLLQYLTQLQNYIASVSDFSKQEQQNTLQTLSENLLKRFESELASVFANLAMVGFNFILVFVYALLFMLYRRKLTRVIMMLVSETEKENARKAVFEMGHVAYHYLWGRIKVMFLLAVLYLITLFLFGVPYAVLLTVAGAVITIIPYIGPLIGIIIPILVYMLHADGIYQVAFFTGIIFVIHLFESYLLEPLIVGREVELNPLMVIVSIIVGGLIWGIAGMIMFVPIFAIVKIASAHFTALKPLGYLLSTEKL